MMRNMWLVAKHEYRNTAGRRAFIIITLAIPLGLIALIALTVVVEMSGESKAPVGYVDHAGLLDAGRQAALPDATDRIQVRDYADEEAARAALERGEIQAFFVLPPDYLQARQTDLYYLEDPPGGEAWEDFDDFVRINLLAQLPEQVQQRVLEGPDVAVLDISNNREFSETGIINVILPFAATFLFFFATMSSAGYMLGVVASEKENRTMEIVLTSLTPGQLIGGKTLGLLAASLTQLAIYVLAVVVGLVVAAPHVPVLQQATVPWDYLGVMALFFFPAYALMAAVMIAIGGAVSEVQQGQQVAGILNLVFMLPILLTPILFQNPGSPLMVGFTLFPPTAFLTISLRWGLGSVPMWQLGLSWVILVAATVFMVWAAARIFRAGMMRYGQPLSLKAAVAAVRAR